MLPQDGYWPDFRGPRRDGRYDDGPVLTDWPADGLRQLWKHPIGLGYASFVVADGHAFTIAPNPFQILTWWAAHTSRIRLGAAAVVAAYWHPIKAAGEAALLDLYSGGRLEFGIGSGAYQREFDRLHPGLKRTDGHRYVHEMLPAVKALWQGDYAHTGEYWSSFRPRPWCRSRCRNPIRRSGSRRARRTRTTSR